MNAIRYFLFSWIVAEFFNTANAFVYQRSTQKFLSRVCPSNSAICMSLENFKDDIDVTSSSESPPSCKPESSEESSSESSFETQQRPHRTQQIESMQGVWWTTEQKEQLVEIRSSYAIFDALQNTYVSSTSPMPPAVAYPLGGTDDILTLRTFKLDASKSTKRSLQWIASPTSKVSVQRGGGTAIGIESPSIQMVSPTSTTSLAWKRCTNPDEFWKSDKVVQGHEECLGNLLESEGPHWSASPVDVLRTCLKGIQSNDRDLVDSLCRFSDLSPSSVVNIGREIRQKNNSEALHSISKYFDISGGVSIWSVVGCHYCSPDACTLKVSIANQGDENKTFEFCLSRETKKPDRTSDDDTDPSDNKMPASNLFNSIMDVELLVNGKTWAIDHIHACSC